MRYRVDNEGQPSKSFRTLDEAADHDLQVKSAATGPRSGTVDELVDTYLRGRSHLERDSVNALKAAAQQIRSRWAGVMAEHVEHDEVQVWISQLEVQHGPKLADGSRALRRASAETRRKALQMLAGAMQIAVRRGALDDNPCRDVSIGRIEQRDAMFIGPGQLRALVDAAGRDGPMVMLLGTCGMRIGEGCRLDVGDVMPSRGRLRVRKSKAGVGRDVPIIGDVVAMLDLDRDPLAPLFVSPLGGRIDPDNWRKRVFIPAVERAGLAGMNIHDLRHTAASMMIASGATIKEVQSALGHRSGKMTLDR